MTICTPIPWSRRATTSIAAVTVLHAESSGAGSSGLAIPSATTTNGQSSAASNPATFSKASISSGRRFGWNQRNGTNAEVKVSPRLANVPRNF